jgi:glycosyltransferase involved in cell wall biosynthesis
MKRIVCFGPGPKFKGGISNYNTSLAKALAAQPDTEVHIVSWTQQYPAIIPREFVDKTSKVDLLAGTDIKVQYITNYNNPFSWQETISQIVDLQPDMVVFQWSIAIQGLPLGYIARQLRKHKNIEVIFDMHFVVQKENSSIDRIFTKFGVNRAHTYLTHAYNTVAELKRLFPKGNYLVNETGKRSQITEQQTVIKLYHPIYDLFKPNPDFDAEGFKKEHGLKKHVFLFFGFIRKYKGLHNAIQAFELLAQKRDDVSLVICGESFWATLDNSKFSTKVKNFLFGIAKSIFLKKSDDEREYNPLALIDELKLQDKVLIKNEFVANEEVHKYFQISDTVLLFYLYATPSGVESLTYNFKMPIVAARVGHFPETIKEGFNGYLAEPENIEDMARVMELSITNPIPRENVEEATKSMSWANYAKAILNR